MIENCDLSYFLNSKIVLLRFVWGGSEVISRGLNCNNGSRRQDLYHKDMGSRLWYGGRWSDGRESGISVTPEHCLGCQQAWKCRLNSGFQVSGGTLDFQRRHIANAAPQHEYEPLWMVKNRFFLVNLPDSALHQLLYRPQIALDNAKSVINSVRTWSSWGRIWHGWEQWLWSHPSFSRL